MNYSKIESKVQKFIIKSKFHSKNNGISLIGIKIKINIIKY